MLRRGVGPDRVAWGGLRGRLPLRRDRLDGPSYPSRSPRRRDDGVRWPDRRRKPV